MLSQNIKTVFIADDDEDDLEMFEAAFGELLPSANIVSALDGLQLFDNLSLKTPPLPDLIVLDINMPKLNGYESIKRLKEHELYKHIPIVILSTSIVPKDIDFMYSVGAICYIRKQNTFKNFKQVLGRILGGHCLDKQRNKESFLIS